MTTPYPTLRFKLTPPNSLRLLVQNAAGTGTPGATGPAGAQGPAGPTGPAASLGPDLTAIEALTLTGILVRTAADTWTMRTITGTANEVTVNDGAGVAANPTLSLPAALTFTGKTVTGGTFAGPAMSSFIDFVEIASPSNPAADHLKLFAKDVAGATHAFTRDSAGVEVDLSAAAAGGVSSLNGQTGALALLLVPQGRLTLQTGVPVMTTTQAAKTTIYYTAYQGNMIPIYDGTNMVPTVITGGEISVATTDTAKSPAAIGASKMNDFFVWNDGGTIRLGHGPDWTNDTTRSAGTALALINGIYTNNVSITNGPVANRGTWVGTTRSNASSQLDWIFGGLGAGGVAGFFGVGNAYNLVDFATFVADSTDSWTYATATWRASNASNAMRVSYVDPTGTQAVEARNYGLPFNASSLFSCIGVGLDTTSNFSGAPAVTSFSSSQFASITAEYVGIPGLGFHFLQAVENVPTGGTSTFRGDNGVPTYVQCGLMVRLRA